MTFLSGLAVLVAILLMAFGANLADTGKNAAQQPAIETPAPSADASVATAAASAAASEAPSPAVSAQAAIDSGAWITREQSLSDAQTLATYMYAGIMNTGAYTPPQFVSDTADTHLAARWVDYMRASTAKSDSTKLVAFNRPGVTPALKSISISGAKLESKVACKLSLKTASGDKYEPEVTLILTYEKSAAGQSSVTGIRLVGDDAFDKLSALAGEGAQASAIDAAVDKAISDLG